MYIHCNLTSVYVSARLTMNTPLLHIIYCSFFAYIVLLWLFELINQIAQLKKDDIEIVQDCVVTFISCKVRQGYCLERPIARRQFYT